MNTLVLENRDLVNLKSYLDTAIFVNVFRNFKKKIFFPFSGIDNSGQIVRASIKQHLRTRFEPRVQQTMNVAVF